MKNEKNIQMTGVATATTTTTNGNGTGKKAKAENTPIENVKVIPFGEFDRENAVKIVPHIDYLTAKGIEIYTDMGNLENAKLFIDDLGMRFGGGTTELTGLMMLLDAIDRKINGEDDRDMAEDFIAFLQNHLFYWLTEADRAADVYVEAIRSGNFVVGEKPEGAYEVNAIDMRPPKHKLKAQETAFRAEIEALAETVKNLQAKLESSKPEDVISGSKTGINDSPIIPADFEGLYLSELWTCKWVKPNHALFVDAQMFPGEEDGRVISAYYRKRDDGRFDLQINYLPPSEEEYPYPVKDEIEQSDTTPGIAKERDKYTRHRLQIMTNQVCHVLKSDKVSDDMKEAFTSIIFEAGNEAGMAVTDPDLIKVALPKIINSFEFNYGSGIVLAIDALLNSFLGSNFYDEELRRYEKPLHEKESDDLAEHLSAILNNPETPEKLYNAISDELSSLFDGDELNKTVNSVEFIRKALTKRETALAA